MAIQQRTSADLRQGAILDGIAVILIATIAAAVFTWLSGAAVVLAPGDELTGTAAAGQALEVPAYDFRMTEKGLAVPAAPVAGQRDYDYKMDGVVPRAAAGAAAWSAVTPERYVFLMDEKGIAP